MATSKKVVKGKATKPKAAAAAAAKAKPSEKAIKDFFKQISLDNVGKVKAALAAGMDPNVRFEATPAIVDAIGHDDIARALIDAGADVTATSKVGDTALHGVEDVKLAKLLIARGADVDAKTKLGRTPLHDAAVFERLDVMKVLLDAGAAVDVADKDGLTPYATASSAAVRALLKQRGAKGFGPGGGTVLKVKRAKTTRAKVAESDGAIGLDHDGRVWVGRNAMLFIVDGDDVTQFKFAETFSVAAIAPGPKGVMYFATNWGLLQYAKDAFTLFSSSNSELFDNHILQMRTDAAGRAYLIAYEGEAEEKHVTVFDGKQFTLLSPGKELPRKLAEMEAIGFGAKGELILGYDDGVAIRRNGTWTKKKLDGQVYDIATTGDAWWLAAGHSVVEVRDGKFIKHETPKLAKCVCVDGATVWVGTYYGGIYRIDIGTRKKAEELPAIHAEGSELPHDDVDQLVRAPDGTIWIQANHKLATMRDGVVEAFGAKKQPPKPAPAAKQPKLVAFPAKPLLAELPDHVAAAITSTTLSGIAHADLLKLVRPGIAFDVTKQKAIPVGASKFGGKPDLPASLAWPAYDDDEDRMLPFILQINLAEAHAFDLEGLLPERGMLYLFSDTQPDELTGARVVYTADTALERRDFPEDLVDRKDTPDFVAQLPEYALSLAQVFTLPSVALLRRRAALTDADEQALYRLRDDLAGDGSRLLGWPDSVQDEVVDGEHQIALVQLNGHGLSDKAANRVFDHWCSDGLIHAVIDGKALAKRQFDKAAAEMAYT